MPNCQLCIEGINSLLAAMQENVNCALKSAESPATDRQQLKAEIASTVDDLQRAYAMRESPEVLNCIAKLRQLSAI
jgi:hypothetical protein